MIKDVIIREMCCVSHPAELRYSWLDIMAEKSKQPQIAIAEALHLLQTFRGADLTQTIYQIEKSVKGVSAEKYRRRSRRAERRRKFSVRLVW